MRRVKIFKTLEDAEKAISPSGARRLVIGDELIAIARWKDRLYAMQDDCPHSRASLSQGWVNDHGDLICPLHNYCYNLKNGREFNQLTPDAKIYRVEIEESGVYLELPD